MKVLNLECANGHLFEGWFASEDDFHAQISRQLLTCPVCGEQHVERRPSAPRLNLGAGRAEQSPAARRGGEQPSDPTAAPSGPPALMHPGPDGNAPREALQAAWMQLMRQVLEKTEDVGGRFADEARRIHHGDAPDRAIRGQASPEQTAELLEEGIEVLPLPIPDALKTPLQ